MGDAEEVDLPPGYRPDDVIDLPPGYSEEDVIQPATMGDFRAMEDRTAPAPPPAPTPVADIARQRLAGMQPPPGAAPRLRELTEPRPISPEALADRTLGRQPDRPDDYAGSVFSEVKAQGPFSVEQVDAAATAISSGAVPRIPKVPYPIAKALVETANSLGSPENIVLLRGAAPLKMLGGLGKMAYPVIEQALGGVFKYMMAEGAAGGAMRAAEAYGAGDPEAALYEATHAVTSGALVGAPHVSQAARAFAKARGQNVPGFPFSPEGQRPPVDFTPDQSFGLEQPMAPPPPEPVTAPPTMSPQERLRMSLVERQRQRDFRQPQGRGAVSPVFEGEARPPAPKRETIADLTLDEAPELPPGYTMDDVDAFINEPEPPTPDMPPAEIARPEPSYEAGFRERGPERRVTPDFDRMPEQELRQVARRQYDELQIADNDALTGLPGRRSYDRDRADAGLYEAAVDMDGLKRINDTHGHEAGDAALRALSDALRAVSEETGTTFYRKGGDEISGLGIERQMDDALFRRQGEFDRGEVEIVTKSGKRLQVRMGFSYGTGPTAEIADAALYRNKAGRKAVEEIAFRPESFGGRAGPVEGPGRGGREHPVRPEETELDLEREALQAEEPPAPDFALEAGRRDFARVMAPTPEEIAAQRLREHVESKKPKKVGTYADPNRIMSPTAQRFKEEVAGRQASSGVTYSPITGRPVQPRKSKLPKVAESPVPLPSPEPAEGAPTKPDTRREGEQKAQDFRMAAREAQELVFALARHKTAEARAEFLQEKAPTPELVRAALARTKEGRGFEDIRTALEEYGGGRETITEFSPEASERMRLSDESLRTEAPKAREDKPVVGDLFGEQSGKGGKQQTLDDALGSTSPRRGVVPSTPNEITLDGLNKEQAVKSLEEVEEMLDLGGSPEENSRHKRYRSILRQRIKDLDNAAKPKKTGEEGFLRKRMSKVVEPKKGTLEAAKLAGRPQLSVSPVALPKGEQLVPSAIVKQIAKSFGKFGFLPIKTGHFRQQAHGITKIPHEVIRLERANDIVTLAHELGHHVQEHVLKLPTGKSGGVYEAELAKLGAATSRPSYKPDQVQMEGTAEFMRHYLFDPDKARGLAPSYAKVFEAALDKHPDVAAAVRAAQAQLRGHYALSPVERVKSKIDFEGDRETEGSAAQRAATEWIDRYQPIRDAVNTMAGGQSRNLLSDAYALARLTSGGAGKAKGFLENGVELRDGTKLSGSYADAIKLVGNKRQDFAAYLVSKRIVEDLSTRGIEAGIELADAKATVEALETPEFLKAAEGIYAYEDALLRYAVSEDAMSQEQYAAIKKLNQYHVPFQRVRDAVETALSGGSQKLADRGSPVKRIRGSGRDIINPLESIVANTHTIIDMVDKNAATIALTDQIDTTPGSGRFMDAVPNPMEAHQINLRDLTGKIGEALDSAGVEIPDNLGDALDDIVTVFTPSGFSKEKGIITVIKGGTRKWYSVNQTALYDAVTQIGQRNDKLVVGLLERPARLLRAGATLTPGFVGRNIVRDTWAASIQSRYGFRLGWDTLRGLASFVKRDADYYSFMKSGAANANLVSADRKMQRDMLREFAGNKRFRDSIVLHPIEALRALSEASENSTRIGEFKRALEKEGRSAEGRARAALAARDVTVDFDRGGNAARQWNRYAAFFNAAVQGNVRLVEVFKRNPIGATMRATAAITIPTLALAYLNRDNDEYKNLPDWEKNTFWHIPLPGGGWARMPKPHGILKTVFANVPEAFIRHSVSKDPEALDRLFPDEDTAKDALASLMPTALMPMFEVIANYDTFRKRAIVSPWDEHADKELQASRWTSELARVVGPKIGLAPAKFDHLINGYTAGLGRGLTHAIDKPIRALTGRPEPPASGVEKFPLVSAFVRGKVGADAEVLRHFYERVDEVAGAKRSAKLYGEQGDPKKAFERIRKEGPGFEAEAKRLQKAQKDIAEKRAIVNQIFADKDMSPEEKRRRLDEVYRQMIGIATGALPEWREHAVK